MVYVNYIKPKNLERTFSIPTKVTLFGDMQRIGKQYIVSVESPFYTKS